MYRDIFTSKWILGSLALLIIIAGACYVGYKRERAADRKALVETSKLVREWHESRKVRTLDSTAEIPIPAQSNTQNAGITVNESVAEVKNNTEVETQQQSETAAANAEAEDVPTSPFGSGPYPDVPDDLRSIERFKPIWEYEDWTNKHQDPKGAELLDRVWIKAWENGEREILGASFNPENNRVYLNYPNTIYVWYDEYEADDGTPGRYFTLIKGAGDVKLTKEQKLRGEAPPGVQVIDGETGGIDPYEYLHQ